VKLQKNVFHPSKIFHHGLVRSSDFENLKFQILKKRAHTFYFRVSQDKVVSQLSILKKIPSEKIFPYSRLQKVKTEEGKVYGGFSDQLWNDNDGISRQSHKTWLFSLSEKIKYTLPSDWPAPITGTYGAGFCFGGRQDLEIIFSHSLLPYPNPNPNLFNYKKNCYGRFNPIVYEDPAKKVQRNQMMPQGMQGFPGMQNLPGMLQSQQKNQPMLPIKQFPLPTPKIQPLDLEQIKKNQNFQIVHFEKGSQPGLPSSLQMLQMGSPPMLGLPGIPQNSSFAVLEVEVFHIVPE